MASISVYNIGNTSFSFKLTGLQTKGSDGKDLTYVRRCQWNVRDKNNNSLYNPSEYIEPGETEGVSHTVTGLSSNTTYTVSCSVYRINDNDTETYLDGFSEEVTTSSSGGSGWVVRNAGTITTDLGVTSFKLQSNTMYIWSVLPDTDGVLSVGIQNATAANDNLCLYVATSMYCDETTGVPYGVIAEIESSKNLFNVTCDVEADTTYYIWVREADGNSTNTLNLIVNLSAPTTPTIARWDWFSVNDTADLAGGTASAEQTEDSYNAITGVGTGRNTLNFSRRVWNDMVAKVNEIVESSYGSWDGDYASYSATRFTFDPYELSAVMFNSLRNNLELAGTSDKIGFEKIPDAPDPDNAYQGTIPHPVSSGDPVYGHYFITLTNYMNDCIDKINGL